MYKYIIICNKYEKYEKNMINMKRKFFYCYN